MLGKITLDPLTFWALLAAPAQAGHMVLQHINRPHAMALAHVAGGAGVIALCFVLVPRYGAGGAALAILIAELATIGVVVPWRAAQAARVPALRHVANLPGYGGGVCRQRRLRLAGHRRNRNRRPTPADRSRRHLGGSDGGSGLVYPSDAGPARVGQGQAAETSRRPEVIIPNPARQTPHGKGAEGFANAHRKSASPIPLDLFDGLVTDCQGTIVNSRSRQGYGFSHHWRSAGRSSHPVHIELIL